MTRPIQSWMEPSNARLAKLASLVTLPAYVRQVNMTDLRPEENVKRASFADMNHKDYPCHTKAATYLSYADFKFFGQSKLADAREIGNRLNHFVDYWQIRHDAQEIDKVAAAANKGLPDDHFAFVLKTGNTKQRSLRIKDAAEIKEAIQFLKANQYELNISERKMASCNILDRVAKLATALTVPDVDFLEKQAGRGMPASQKDLVHALESRSFHCKQSHIDISNRFKKIAEQIKLTPVEGPAQLMKLATAIEQADCVTGLFGNYTDRLPSPNDLVFGVTPTAKTAAENNIFRTPTGRVYHASDLKKIALAEVTNLLGIDFTNSVRDGVHLDVAKLQNKMASSNIGHQRMLEAFFDKNCIKFQHA